MYTRAADYSGYEKLTSVLQPGHRSNNSSRGNMDAILNTSREAQLASSNYNRAQVSASNQSIGPGPAHKPKQHSISSPFTKASARMKSTKTSKVKKSPSKSKSKPKPTQGLGAIADHIKMKAMMNKQIVSTQNFVNNPVGSLSKAIENETARRLEAIKLKRQNLKKGVKRTNQTSIVDSLGHSKVIEGQPHHVDE